MTIEDQIKVYSYYGLDKLYEITFSIIRDDNTNTPAFTTYLKEDTIRWSDFGVNKFGDVYNLVMLKEEVTFKEALNIIKSILNRDDVESLLDLKPTANGVTKKIKAAKDLLFIESNSWDEHEWYFLQRGVSKEQLEENLIAPLRVLFSNKSYVTHSTVGNPIYIYFTDKGKKSFKIYSPTKEKSNKWLSQNITVKDLELDVVRENSSLLLFSARKDKMVGDNALKAIGKSGEYDTSSLLSEGNFGRFITNIGEYDMYKDILYIPDFDKKGLEFAESFRSKSNGRVTPLIPSADVLDYLTKNNLTDLDDIVMSLGVGRLNDFLNKLL